MLSGVLRLFGNRNHHSGWCFRAELFIIYYHHIQNLTADFVVLPVHPGLLHLPLMDHVLVCSLAAATCHQ